jgi:replicative DNA helicase
MARPETGKTTFLSSEVSYMAEQLPEGAGPILWFNNEEQGDKVQTRCYQASLGLPLAELMSNRPLNTERYLSNNGGQIKIHDNSEIHRNRVEAICRSLNPSLIIFDQLDKIKGFAADREDLRLGAIYIWARELAKKYCPVIGVCQADGTAEGVKWLTMDHVANAKTSKQAEADFILGIGCIHDPAFEFVRFFNISKNKLQGDEDTDPKLRHGRFECLIRPEVARYEDYK